jgi:hypothetical protein
MDDKYKELAERVAKGEKNSNRIKCWLCDRWVLERHVRTIPFNGVNERVCVSCYDNLASQDEALDMIIDDI